MQKWLKHSLAPESDKARDSTAPPPADAKPSNDPPTAEDIQNADRSDWLFSAPSSLIEASYAEEFDVDELDASAKKVTSFEHLMRALDGGRKITATMSAEEAVEHDKGVRQVFLNDVNRLRSRLKQARRGFVNPNAKPMQYWDMVTGISLLFVALVTPFEVGLGVETKADALFVINQAVNLVFVFDICLQFFLPVPDPERGGELIRNHRKLARRYLRSWFTIDVVSILPIDVIVFAAPSLLGDSSLVKSIKLLRILRLVKLVRVIRASRIFQRWESSISISMSSRAILGAWICFVLTLHWLACLWAMLPQLVPTWREASGVEEALRWRMTQDASCTGCLPRLNSAACASPCLTPCEREVVMATHNTSAEQVVHSEPWQCRAHALGYLPYDWPTRYADTYLVAAVVAMMQLLGGVATLYPTNTPENVLFLLSALIGTMLFAAVQGVIVQVMTTGGACARPHVRPASRHIIPQPYRDVCVGGKGGRHRLRIPLLSSHTMCTTAANGERTADHRPRSHNACHADPDEMRFRQNMDGLNTMMHDMFVPHDLKVAVRSYYRKSKQLVKRKSYAYLIDETVSSKLRGDLLTHLSTHLFDSVWWLKACDRNVLEKLSMHVQREAFSANEKVPNSDPAGQPRLIILVTGVVHRAGAIFTTGAWWGDLILTSPALRDTREAKALGYCEVATLSRTRLFDILDGYPEAAKIIRHAALKLSVQRAMIVIAMYARIRIAQNLAKARASQPKKPLRMKSLLKRAGTKANLLQDYEKRNQSLFGSSTEQALTELRETGQDLPKAGDTLHQLRQQMMGEKNWLEVAYEEKQPVDIIATSGPGGASVAGAANAPACGLMSHMAGGFAAAVTTAAGNASSGAERGPRTGLAHLARSRLHAKRLMGKRAKVPEAGYTVREQHTGLATLAREVAGVVGRLERMEKVTARHAESTMRLEALLVTAIRGGALDSHAGVDAQRAPPQSGRPPTNLFPGQLQA